MDNKEIAEEIKETEERLARLRAKLEEPELKYKVGDRVLIEAEVVEIEPECNEGLPYGILINLDGGTYKQWVGPSDVHSKIDPIEYHNPDNLTQNEVGEGYRLLTKAEVESIGENHLYDCQFWEGKSWSRVSGWYIVEDTIRVDAKKYPVGSLEIK